VGAYESVLFMATATPTITLTPTFQSTFTPTPTLGPTETLTPTVTSTPSDVRSLFTPGLYDPSSSTFYLLEQNSDNSPYNQFVFAPLGQPNGTLLPLLGDWQGTGYDSAGLYDSKTGTFYLNYSNTNRNSPDSSFQIDSSAGPNSYPITGKWLNSLSNSGVGVFDSSTGLVYLKNSLTTGYADYSVLFGMPGIGASTIISGQWAGDNGPYSLGVVSNTSMSSGLDNVASLNTANPPQFSLSNYNFNNCPSRNCELTSSIPTFTLPNAPLDFSIPIAGDWFKTGSAGVGLYYPSTNTFYLHNDLNQGGTDITFSFAGATTNLIPIAGKTALNTIPSPKMRGEKKQGNQVK